MNPEFLFKFCVGWAVISLICAFFLNPSDASTSEDSAKETKGLLSTALTIFFWPLLVIGVIFIGPLIAIFVMIRGIFE